MNSSEKALGKRPGAMRTIGEVSDALGIRQHVLRYWETQFPMLQPVKRSGSRRYYRPEDITLLATIDRLVHQEGYTLKGACQLIEAGQAGNAAALQSKAATVPADPDGESLHDSLKKLRDRLAVSLASS
ncbi:MerR family transcriptional regulator [Novosphingobium profundi]|uniref:MerR family transcriptional regulator n=1 Tax=Novosphingobium profundi TaxID=1774954 RepID=UPI001BDA69B5|nr:MerR family transcriptional regulator [Novosphingobium profundi]MBT0669696.1 MerR family transcriptional regulator [Novosphingobium profundi]